MHELFEWFSHSISKRQALLVLQQQCLRQDQDTIAERKMVQIHNGKYQFKVPFILYTDFESILKPVDEKYREKMNQMKTERKGKPSFTEKIKAHVSSGWCVHNTFAYGVNPTRFIDSCRLIASV